MIESYNMQFFCNICSKIKHKLAWRHLNDLLMSILIKVWVNSDPLAENIRVKKLIIPGMSISMGAARYSELPKVRYSEGSLFRRLVIPNARFSEGSLFRRLVIPKVRYSEGSLFRRFVIPKVRYSEGSLFRRFVIPKVRYSEGSLFWRLVIPKVRYSEGSLFRRFAILKVRYSEHTISYTWRFVNPKMK